MKKSRLWTLVATGVFLGATSCGGSVEQVHETDIAADLAERGVHPEGNEPKEPPPQPVISTVTRPELNGVIEKGPPLVLAMVQVDSVLENGKFVGWKIVSFRTEAQEILGLKPEDILTRVNAMPIERPEQIEAVYQKLKTADKISFDIIRAGQKQQLVSPIQP